MSSQSSNASYDEDGDIEMPDDNSEGIDASGQEAINDVKMDEEEPNEVSGSPDVEKIEKEVTVEKKEANTPPKETKAPQKRKSGNSTATRRPKKQKTPKKAPKAKPKAKTTKPAPTTKEPETTNKERKTAKRKRVEPKTAKPSKSETSPKKKKQKKSPSPRKPVQRTLTAPDDKDPPVVALTSFSDSTEKKKVFRILDAFDNDVEKFSTDVLVVGKDNQRTMKVLRAIAFGIPVVTKDWVQQSKTKHSWQPVDQFYSSKFKDGVKKSRKALRSGSPLLAKKSLLVRAGAHSRPSKKEIQELVLALGGTLAKASNRADYIISTRRVAIDEEDVVVNPKWLFDAIEHYDVPDVTKKEYTSWEDSEE